MRFAGVLMLAVALLVAGCSPASLTPTASRTAAGPAVPEERSTTAVPAATAPIGDLSAAKRFRSTRRHERIAAPVAVRIPAIEITSTLERLGRAPDGTVEVPTDWDQAGWYADGFKPGEHGPAVILGHVDSQAGPAVFFRLHELAAGDDVLVERRDGSVARFVVRRIEQHDKDRFPTEDVYFPTLRRTLRLVTCGGEFDPSVGHYRDNVIVFAEQRP